MALTLVRIDLETENNATAVFREDDGAEVPFRFHLDGHDDVTVAHAEESFADAYLAVPGPDVPQAHLLARLMRDLIAIRNQPLPSGEALALAWSKVGDELEHDWASQEEA